MKRKRSPLDKVASPLCRHAGSAAMIGLPCPFLTRAYMGLRLRLSLSTIQASRFSRPASVLASRYARV